MILSQNMAVMVYSGLALLLPAVFRGFTEYDFVTKHGCDGLFRDGPASVGQYYGDSLNVILLQNMDVMVYACLAMCWIDSAPCRV